MRCSPLIAVLTAAIALAGCASTAPTGGHRSGETIVASAVPIGSPPPTHPPARPTPVSNPPLPPPPAAARRYAWADGQDSLLGVGACLLLVRGAGPTQVLHTLVDGGHAHQVTRLLPLAAAESVADRRTASDVKHAYSVVGVAEQDGWTLVLEDNGFMCTDTRSLTTMTAAGGVAVSMYSNPAGGDYFRYARAGRLLRSFEPDVDADDDGTRPLPQERDLPFGSSVYSFALSMVLTQRLTGVRLRPADVTLRSTYRQAIVTEY